MKVVFISLGCDKNLVDTEKMLGLLVRHGYEITDQAEEADIAIVNTCSFIGDAKEESIQEILSLAELKKKGQLKCLVITGCLSQRYREEIREELPEVDGCLGIANWDQIVPLVESSLAGKHPEFFDSIHDNVQPILRCDVKRMLTTGGHYAYLKIAEGCSKYCTYCSIPMIRGKYHSVPMEKLLAEARELADGGVKELILVAQETTVYGVDLYAKKSLPELLAALGEIEGLEMIRLLYCYPEEITEELVQEVKKNPKVCHYFDIPIQHCENEILKAMGRLTTKEELVEKIRYIRQELPDVALRTTLIAGFPGETEAQHEAVLDFIDEMEFEHLGAFAYSPEEGTKAAAMDNQVDEETKKRWVDDIMSLQQEICIDNHQKWIGKVLRVMVEGYLPEDNACVGRSFLDAPGVDGYIFFRSNHSFMSGDMVNVRVTGASEYDLIGEWEDESAE